MMRVGILGPGKIAHTIAKTIAGMDKVIVRAVGSRNLVTAEAFAAGYGIESAYGSYEELVSDPDVDLVYVATPHSCHYDHVKLALENKKHVLCEKAFMLNAAQTEEVLQLARDNTCLLAEAIWTRYMPSRQMIRNVMSSGIIGTPTSLTANLGYMLKEVERVMDPALGGGALLDVGVYPINFALMAFGDDYDTIISKAVFNERGADISDSITITWEDGRIAVLHASACASTDRRGIIYGNQGYIEIQNINNCECILIFDLKRNLVGEMEVPKQITGYEYQFEACREAIARGWIECPQMPHEVTLEVMHILDEIRRQWNYKFPDEINGKWNLW